MFCLKSYLTKGNLTKHLKNCKIKKQIENDKEKQHKEEITNYKGEIIKYKNEVIKLKKQLEKDNVKHIQKSIKKLETAIPANTNLILSNQLIEKIIQKDKKIEELCIGQNKSNLPNANLEKLIENEYLDKLIKDEYCDNNEITQEIKPMTLILNENVIECRKSDGYINATQLCKAGGKKFSHWINLESTKELISVLETNAGIPALNLIDKKIGGNHSSTFIHSELAIQLAQWISPTFALQVSLWIRTLFTQGKVEVNIKLIKEQENIIKDCKRRIKLLEDHTLKRQPRTQYDESKNVVYIITNEFTKKKRTYTIGKAKSLVERLSTYDKLQDLL